MSDTPNLFSLARSKLQVSVGGKDKCSLHRWVLLKNSIVHSPSVACNPSVSDNSRINSVNDDPDEEVSSEELDSFMFPDAGKLVSGPAADVNASEAEWLNSLLETLGDDDDEEFTVESDSNGSILPVDEDDEPLLFSPMVSPMSSTDDLPSQSSYYPASVNVSYSYPYLVPYPPFQSSTTHPYAEFDSLSSFPAYDDPLPYSYAEFDSLSSLPAPYDDPLPYHELTESENLSVPDAIEDSSDDESDSPRTPSFGRSSSSLALERSGLQHTIPNVRVDGDDSYLFPFEFDPLPFPEDDHTYNIHLGC